ncbi:hypothetical protein [Flavobacterium sp.]|jgi:hypothetical protein|uniref:hypothetical protein n=1 Tax=Flavobacterium sp. TaxID=239 RepID=UPI0037C132BA
MLQQQVSSFQQAIRTDLLKGQEAIYNNIVTDSNIAVMREQDFVSFFLPCFAGMINPPNWIVNWIQISGAATAEVSIISADGQQLFTVPPLLASSKVFLVNRAGSLGDIFRQQELLKNSLTTNANEVLFRQLDSKVHEIEQIQSESVKSRWDAIFARYNIVFNTATQSASPSTDTDFLEYE